MICQTWQCITMGRKCTKKTCSEQDRHARAGTVWGRPTAHQQSKNKLRIERKPLAKLAVQPVVSGDTDQRGAACHSLLFGPSLGKISFPNICLVFSFPGKAPMPRPHYKPQEPNGCSSHFLGLKVPESVCTVPPTTPKGCSSLSTLPAHNSGQGKGCAVLGSSVTITYVHIATSECILHTCPFTSSHTFCLCQALN